MKVFADVHPVGSIEFAIFARWWLVPVGRYQYCPPEPSEVKPAAPIPKSKYLIFHPTREVNVDLVINET